MQKTVEKKNLTVVLHNLRYFTFKRASLTLLHSHLEVIPHEIIFLFYVGFLLR